MSIRTKVMLAIVLAVVLSIAGVSVMISVQMRSAFVTNYEISSKAQLSRLESFVDLFFANAIANAELLASSPLVLEQIDNLTSYAGLKESVMSDGDKLPAGERELFHELDRIVEAFKAFSLIYIGNNQGGLIFAPDVKVPVGYNPSIQSWYTSTISAGKGVITQAYVSNSGEAVCTVAAPIRKDSRSPWAGVVGFDIALETLTNETGGVKVGKTGYVLMLDATGKIISDPQYSGDDIPADKRWLGKTVSQLPKDAAAAIGKLQTMNTDEVTTVTFDGKDWLAGVEITGTGWYLIMLQEEDEVFSNAMSVTMSILIVGMVIALLMAAVAWFIARSISGPVATLAKASQAVAEGNLDAIPDDERLFSGELRLLHTSLKSMVGKLGELIETANAKMREAETALAESKKSLEEAEEAKKQADLARREGVLQTAERIGELLDPLSSATKRLNEEAGDMGQRAAEQQGLVSGSAYGIEQLNSVVEEVARSTSRTAQLAEETQEEARNGRQLVLEVVSNMGKIQEQSTALSGSLENLGVQVVDIGQIMSVINDIADQTNLLALNAAIEAARAGETGRGFAVVADEVRKLAEKTMEATKQVGTAITTIRNGTESNVSAMQEALNFVSVATEVANDAGEALGKIEGMVEKTADEIRSIATASEEQSATAQEIHNGTEQIKSISDAVAESADRSNEAVHDLLDLSSKLNDLVENLRKE